MTINMWSNKHTWKGSPLARLAAYQTAPLHSFCSRPFAAYSRKPLFYVKKNASAPLRLSHGFSLSFPPANFSSCSSYLPQATTTPPIQAIPVPLCNGLQSLNLQNRFWMFHHMCHFLIAPSAHYRDSPMASPNMTRGSLGFLHVAK